MNRYVEYGIIVFVLISIILTMSLSTRAAKKSNFLVICEAKGNTKEFCKNSWNSHKE